MKYSLKNRQFTKRRNPIFDHWSKGQLENNLNENRFEGDEWKTSNVNTKPSVKEQKNSLLRQITQEQMDEELHHNMKKSSRSKSPKKYQNINHVIKYQSNHVIKYEGNQHPNQQKNHQIAFKTLEQPHIQAQQRTITIHLPSHQKVSSSQQNVKVGPSQQSIKVSKHGISPIANPLKHCVISSLAQKNLLKQERIIQIMNPLSIQKAVNHQNQKRFVDATHAQNLLSRKITKQITSEFVLEQVFSFKIYPKGRQTHESSVTEQLKQLYKILIANYTYIDGLEQRLTESIKTIKRMHEEREKYIKISINLKYQQYCQVLQQKMQAIQHAIIHSQEIDSKVNIFQNTLRNVYESLRITKLKQQNLELIIKNQKVPDKCSEINFKTIQNQIKNNVINNRRENEQFVKMLECESQISSISNKQSEIQMYEEQKWGKLAQFKHNKKGYASQIYEINTHRNSPYEQFLNHQEEAPTVSLKNNNFNAKKQQESQHNIFRNSPFQANVLIKDNNHTHTNHTPPNHTPPNHTHTKSQKHVNAKNVQSKYIHQFEPKQKAFESSLEQIHNNQKYSKQLPYEYSFQSPTVTRQELNSFDNSNSSKNAFEIQSLLKILQSKKFEKPLHCWLDEMSCLRKSNMTYIFDEDGAVVTCTPETYLKLSQMNKICIAKPEDQYQFD